MEIPGRGDQLFVVPTTPWRLDHEEARGWGDPTHRRRIDYILTRARVSSVQLVGDRPVDGVWLSDHCGVLAEI
ncbi:MULTISPECIES: hypothetical protein [Kribbella]|uniref:hypothetical protein n=1 Tax=Kribbella TaxID=182639 RepID=UPI00104F62DF|nr:MULTISPECIES: hypothetical protein [Kribbella]